MEDVIDLLFKRFFEQLSSDNPDISSLLACCDYQYTAAKVKDELMSIVDNHIESLNEE